METKATMNERTANMQAMTETLNDRDASASDSSVILRSRFDSASDASAIAFDFSSAANDSAVIARTLSSDLSESSATDRDLSSEDSSFASGGSIAIDPETESPKLRWMSVVLVTKSEKLRIARSKLSSMKTPFVSSICTCAAAVVVSVLSVANAVVFHSKAIATVAYIAAAVLVLASFANALYTALR